MGKGVSVMTRPFSCNDTGRKRKNDIAHGSSTMPSTLCVHIQEDGDKDTRSGCWGLEANLKPSQLAGWCHCYCKPRHPLVPRP